MGWFRRKVLVTFVDDATGQAIARNKIPPDDLPESLGAETTIRMGETDWSVVGADPSTKQEYTSAGSLTLRLRRIETIATKEISFSQLDVTDRFDDEQSLGTDEWIATTPLHSMIPNPTSAGLPSPDADAEEVYRVASSLSELRESIPIPDDGVYCPICHIANVDLAKLRTPCPQCGRPLLKFGWT